MQKCGKILRGQKDTLTPVVSTLRGRATHRPRCSDASAVYGIILNCVKLQDVMMDGKIRQRLLRGDST